MADLHKYYLGNTFTYENIKEDFKCPEIPERILSIFNYLEQSGLLSKMKSLPVTESSNALSEAEINFLENEILTLIHTKDYINSIKERCQKIE